MVLTIKLRDGEPFLSEKDMEGLTIPVKRAARWIGVTPATIYNWEKAKKVILAKNREMPLTEYARLKRLTA